MNYIEAIQECPAESPSVFLAGGITGCVDWQKIMVGLLEEMTVSLSVPLTVINPRRANFPIGDPDAGRVQIEWEHDRLLEADAVSFWFPAETLCPITLYELGTWTGKSKFNGKEIFIGIHPQYQRKFDVEIQTKLALPKLKIVYSLEDLAKQIANWVG